MKNETIIFCDGASKGNPGPGGWGAVVIQNNFGTRGARVTELGGREEHTTNNRMELTAAIKALALVSQSADILVKTDSKYLRDGITSWITNWQKNNWRTKAKKPVLNKDLWQELLKVSADKKIDWEYVEGHAGVTGNERGDEIASAFALGETVDLYDGPSDKYKIKLV